MSAQVEVVFDVERDKGESRKAANRPVGVVRGIEIVGTDVFRPMLIKWGLIRVATQLPLDVAKYTIDFWRANVARRQGAYNCLGYMAVSQGREIGIDELDRGTGPDLVIGKFTEVKDPTQLTSGAEYGLPDDDDRLIHGIVGTGCADRHLEVTAVGGELRYSRTTDTLTGYQTNCGYPARLVALEPGGYQSSEVVRTPRAA